MPKPLQQTEQLIFMTRALKPRTVYFRIPVRAILSSVCTTTWCLSYTTEFTLNGGWDYRSRLSYEQYGALETFFFLLRCGVENKAGYN